MLSFQENRRREMLDSLYLGFHYSNKLNESIILEAKSRVPNIDEYIEKFVDLVSRITNYGEITRYFVVKDNIFANITGCWFNGIELKIEYNNTKPLAIQGRFESKADFKNGKIDVLRGTFILHGQWADVVNKIPEIVSHEFLHAYETWKRFCDGKKSMFDTAKDGFVLNNNQILFNPENMTEKILSEIYYYSNALERRAFAAQLNQELLGHKNEIHDEESAMRVLEDTLIYKNFITYGQNLLVLSQYIKTNNFYRQDIEKYYKKLTGKEAKAEDVIRYMKRIYQKAWYFIRKKATAFIKTLYENNDVDPDWIEFFD